MGRRVLRTDRRLWVRVRADLCFPPSTAHLRVLLSRSVFAPLAPMIGYRTLLALSVGESICLIFTRRTILLIFWCYYYSHAPACSLWCSCEMEQLMPAIFVSWKFFRFMMPSSRRKCIDWLCKCLLLELPIRFLYLLHLSFSKHMDTGIFANMVLIQGPGAKQEYLFYMAFFKVIIGVGFLRYFQVKQLPNFLLASPILSVAVCSIIWYASSLPKVFQSLMEGRIFISMLYPVGDNPNLEYTSQSNCRISSKPLEGDHILRRQKKESGDWF